MARNKEHKPFLDFVEGRTEDPYPRRVEIAATDKEIGWWKKYQLKRAIEHAEDGEATLEELIFLAKRGKIYPETPLEYVEKYKK